MKYKSFSEMFLGQYLLDKKKAAEAKEESTRRLIDKRNTAMKLFKETKRQEYREQVEFYDRILNRAGVEKAA